MRILKHGDLKPRKFVCRFCGCEFVAEIGEYKITNPAENYFWYSVYCPECDSYIDNSEHWEE